jgi:phosphoribosylaminoimidazolecarboxamide formyltransferase/IMP cyclohydrolase
MAATEGNFQVWQKEDIPLGIQLERPLALLSVSDKDGIVDFARGLIELGYDVVSTGGTFRVLKDGGLKPSDISQLTHAPEMLGGRVKTLHADVFGGILARRDVPDDMATLFQRNIRKIDVVAVNLYPFAKTAAKPGVQDHEVIEQIDIGGPSLLRAAAKNHASVYSICDPADYSRVLELLRGDDDAAGLQLRRELARKVFGHCSLYDAAIEAYFCGPDTE